MTDIYEHVFREIDDQFNSLFQHHDMSVQRHIELLEWRIKNLQQRMVGHSDEENRELIERSMEYELEIEELRRNPPRVPPLSIHVVERESSGAEPLPGWTIDKGANPQLLRAWIRDESGL